MDIFTDIAARFRELNIAFHYTPELAPETSLHPDELASIAHASPVRRREFATGRACAREAIRALGIAGDIPLPRGPFREPMFPDGVTGSISHTDGMTCAAAAFSRDYRAVGIDIQILGRSVSMDAAGQILNIDEHEWMNVPDGILAAFSIKEAFFKMTRCLTDTPYWFDKVSLRQPDADGQVLCRYQTPAGIYEKIAEFRRNESYIFSFCTLRADELLEGINLRTPVNPRTSSGR
ncbi:MAG: 4'-phosphopantetheinyl transferase superfamily protein [Brevinematales bacterium]|nr:4'-phosphopantetheinyl transferase superfamily protein [Brevinematales bacterium]